MSFDFDVESPYDVDVAEAGVDFNITKSGKDFGTFKLRYLDQTTQRGELEIKKLKSMYAKQLRLKTLDDWETIKIVLCHLNLVDWSGITAKGKPVPFSVDTALAYFSLESTRWIALELAAKVADPANFLSDEDYQAQFEAEFNAEEITKN